MTEPVLTNFTELRLQALVAAASNMDRAINLNDKDAIYSAQRGLREATKPFRSVKKSPLIPEFEALTEQDRKAVFDVGVFCGVANIIEVYSRIRWITAVEETE